MHKVRLDSSRTRTLTITAFLGLFVVAVVVALAARLIPAGRSTLTRRLLHRSDGETTPDN